ncbi:MAG TPA: DUF2085 domain-containing protein [Anaerolineae bacterium]|nr:DUF2085 domain-containing protein [Anaerolineae bacterium]HQK15451.1 DUF2085 domain-containing protein [Anaerolineae bacterium]
MTNEPTPNTRRADFPRFWMWAGIVLAFAGTIAFLLLTPAGLLDKANVIAAAVCHRLPSHSFFIDGHQLPLCQRCSGTFPGALTGLLVQWGVWRRRRAQRFPKRPVFAALTFFAALWGLDGLNSYTTMLLGSPEGILGYAPYPWLRLLTGTLMGMGMSIVLVPAFNQTMWADGEPTAPLRSWAEFAFLLVVELVVAALIYLLEPALLYPTALYSVAGVLAMFICLGAMIFVMALGRDGAFTGWRQIWLPLIWGLIFALIVVGGMNFLRLKIAGTIEGVPGLS